MDREHKWAIYARKSTDSEDKQIHSLKDQIGYLRNLATEQGLLVVETLEEARSAKSPGNRPQFAKLVKLIESGKVNAVLCWKLDRMSRNPIDGGHIQWLLQKGRLLKIRTADRTYLPDDNALIFAVEQGMANQYVRDLAKTTKRGLEFKAKMGWFPGKSPIGYLNSKLGQKRNEQIIADPARFKLVKQMWQMMLTGNYSPMEILRIANEDWKLETPKRGLQGGKALAPSYIYKILTNIFYTGNFEYAGKLYEGKHKPMISMQDYKRVQFLLGNTEQPKNIVHEFPYTGLIRCKNCGAFITATMKTKLIKSTGEQKSYTYYHCSRRVGIDKCREAPITAHELESQIIELLSSYCISDSYYELVTHIITNSSNESLDKENSILQQHKRVIEETERKLQRLLTLVINETITELQYQEQKVELENLLVVQEAQLAEIDVFTEHHYSQIIKAFAFSNSAIKVLKSDDLGGKRNVLKHLGSNQLLGDKKLEITTPDWLKAIKEGEVDATPYLDRFELETAKNHNAKMGNFYFFPLVGKAVEQVRTELLRNAEIEIPDLTAPADSEPPLPC